MQTVLDTLSNLPWGLILGLGATGIPMALLSSLIGIRQKVEIPLWWTLYAIWVAVVLHQDVPSPFTTIVAASLLAGMLHSITQALLVEHYRRNNPWYADQMTGSNGKVAGQFLIMGVLIGAGFGVVVGAIAWGIDRL